MVHRDGLRVALAGRDDVLLEPILRLLLKYIIDPRFGEMVADITSVLLGNVLNLTGGLAPEQFQICIRQLLDKRLSWTPSS